MCGRYAFYQRPSEVRRQIEESGMPCDDCPEDESCRQTYNFPPGSIGLVYRAEVPDYGSGPPRQDNQGPDHFDHDKDAVQDEGAPEGSALQKSEEIRYKLQAMKWGLVPAWTRRSPDYGSVMKTINCRDDSLIENRGMWNTMKKRKRCIVLCQGFYEWLTKGKEKTPHFVKRKDGELMCFAGLWDCVKYEGSDEKHYTYTIITTDSNKQLKFLHNRMPVILDNGSENIRTWLDPNRYEWTKELQSLARPYEHELECYPVNKDVGKVGNNSPSFIIPVNSAENKSNIANFFGNQQKLAQAQVAHNTFAKTEVDAESKEIKAERDGDDSRPTSDSQLSETSAPLPTSPRGVKRGISENISDGHLKYAVSPERKVQRISERPFTSPHPKPAARKMKSATSNGTTSSLSKAPAGTQRITKFFGK